MHLNFAWRLSLPRTRPRGCGCLENSFRSREHAKKFSGGLWRCKRSIQDACVRACVCMMLVSNCKISEREGRQLARAGLRADMFHVQFARLTSPGPKFMEVSVHRTEVTAFACVRCKGVTLWLVLAGMFHKKLIWSRGCWKSLDTNLYSISNALWERGAGVFYYRRTRRGTGSLSSCGGPA